MRTRVLASAAVTFCLVGLLRGGIAPPAPAAAAVRPCSSGLVGLTFDDGPSTTVTGKLIDVLTRRHVPATFFMVGQRVASAPSLAHLAYERGFVIGNHSWAHESLPSLSDDGIRSTLRRTAAALKKAGVHPSTLMRPPYGSTDSRVTRVVTGMGLRPVLWDVDPRNWESGTAGDITTRVLSSLHPHGRNIVLLHDGVARSTTTLAAVPGIISGARARGYCFAELGSSGVPVPPVPLLRISDARVTESDPGTGAELTFRLRLDRPTSRPVSVAVRTVAGSAGEDTDFRPVTRRVEFATGTLMQQVTVRVRGDRVDETREHLRLRLDQPQGLKVPDAVGLGTIVDDDPRPEVTVSDATVTEPAEGSVVVPVRVWMDRPSSRRIVLTVATSPAEADQSDFAPFKSRVVLLAGERRAEISVEVLADDVTDEPEETFTVRVLSALRAHVADGTAVVTILPPEDPPVVG